MTTIFFRPERRLLVAALLLLLFVGGAEAATDEDREVEFRSITWLGYNEALALGRDFDKPVFLYFTANWCSWCKKMQKETYTDPKVIRYLEENFVAVKIDTGKLPSLARKYNAKSLPTLWFLDSQGKGLTSINGFVGPDKFLRVLQYIATKSYEELEFETWMRRHPAD